MFHNNKERKSEKGRYLISCEVHHLICMYNTSHLSPGGIPREVPLYAKGYHDHLSKDFLSTPGTLSAVDERAMHVYKYNTVYQKHSILKNW